MSGSHSAPLAITQSTRDPALTCAGNPAPPAATTPACCIFSWMFKSAFASNLRIKFPDKFVKLFHLILEQRAPVFRIPLLVDLLVCLALLLDPREIFQVMDCFPVVI